MSAPPAAAPIADVRPSTLNRLLNIGHWLDHLATTIFPVAILELARVFGMDWNALLLYGLGGTIAFGAFSLPAGWLGDRWSRRGMMLVFFFGIGASLVLAGLTSSPVELAVALTLVGVFAAIYHPVGLAMLAMDSSNVGRTLGVNGLYGNFGIAFAAAITGGLTWLIDWRAAFIAPGLLSIALGFLFWKLVPHEIKVGGRKSVAAIPVDRAMGKRIFFILSTTTIAGGLIFTSTTQSMPKVFEENLGALTGSTLGIGVLVAGVYVLAAIAQLIVGNLIDRFSLRSVFLPVALSQAPLLLVLGWATDWNLLVLAFAVMFAVFGQIPINDAMVARYAPAEWRARAYALRYIMSFGAAATAIPLIAWLHGQNGGFREVFVVLALFAAASGVAALFFPGRQRLIAAAPQPQAAE
ncbi:MAG: MFS transporter [Reyranellaceae bacterium]